MISVLKPIDLIQKCTEKNPYFQEEASTSTVIAVDNTCTEENSNDNTEVAKLVKKCKKFEQLYKQSEKLKIKMKRAYKQKEMVLKHRIKTLEQQIGINEKLNGFFRVFSSNQIKYASGQLKRMPKWCDKALI